MKKLFFALLAFLFATGALLAQKTFFRRFDSGLQQNDRGWSLYPDSNGYTLVTLLSCDGTGSGLCMGIGKFGLDGELLGVRRYEGLRNCPNCICGTSDGNYVLAGDTESASGDTVIFVMKIDQNGDSLWLKYYDSPHSNYARSINVLPDGDLVIEGDGWPRGRRPEPHKTVIKTDSSGQVKWHKDYVDSFRLAQYGRLTPLRSGELLLCYDAWTWESSRPYCVMAKLDAGGKPIWSKKYFKDLEASPQHVFELPSGHYLLIGSVDSFIPQAGPVTLQLVLTDTAGNKILEKALYNGHTHAYLNNIVAAPDGNFIGAGGHFWQEGDTTAAWLLKFTPDGTVLWERSFLRQTDGLPFWFEDVRNAPVSGIAVSGAVVDKLQNGQYADADAFIMVLDQNGCLQTGTVCSTNIQHITALNAVGTTEKQLPFEILPNPVSNLLQLQRHFSGNAWVIVTDALGQTILQTTIDPLQQWSEWDVSHWPNGCYFVTVADHNTRYSKAFILQK